MRTAVLVVLVATACSRRDSAPGPAPATGSGSATAPGIAAKQPTRVAPEDPKAREAYRTGMRTGRKATDAKTYQDAIKGFDQALAAKQGDARALAERGFARLLDGTDLDAASADLDAAAAHTKDQILLSMIWFNRGLADEKRGATEAALVAFYTANILRPTAAAKQKIAGKTVCPVSIGRTYQAGLGPNATTPIDAPDWLALSKLVLHDVDALPTTEAAAMTALSADEQDRTTPKLPGTIVAMNWDEKIAYAVWKQGSGLRALPVGYAMGGRCPGSVSFELVAAIGTRLHVRGVEMLDDNYQFMCTTKKDPDPHECTDEPGEEAAGTACAGGSRVQRDLVVDTATSTVVLTAEQTASDDPSLLVKAALDPAGLKLTGLACDRVEPFVATASPSPKP